MSGGYETVTSADGTRIAFEQAGDGPPVILIGGAFNDRSTVAGVAAELAPRFTTVRYDRRGRGDSGDSDVYEVRREVEDIAALIDRMGRPTALFGHSSGAVLALEAARAGLPVSKLVVYEPPFIVDDSRPRPGADLAERVRALVQHGQREEAVTLFLTEGPAVPPEAVSAMRADPAWGWFTGLAHTLPYDTEIVGPGNQMQADRIAEIRVPVLAIGGSASPPWLSAGARAVAGLIPGARFVLLEGQDHGVLNQPAALTPLLTGFL